MVRIDHSMWLLPLSSAQSRVNTTTRHSTTTGTNNSVGSLDGRPLVGTRQRLHKAAIHRLNPSYREARHLTYVTRDLFLCRGVAGVTSRPGAQTLERDSCK